METFERKLTITGDAVGLTIPKYFVDNKGFLKGRKVKVTLEFIDGVHRFAATNPQLLAGAFS